jgi:16S rRNA (cytidine1402-2'-O)-methyltransferase
MLIVGGIDIGNRKDISPRLTQTILDADVILVENLQMFIDLCIYLEIKPTAEIIHYYAPMEELKDLSIVSLVEEHLKNNKIVLILSDDGMPGIADPGGRVVHMAHSNGYQVSVVPGPSIISTLPAVLGLDSKRFTFEDELPSDQDSRRKLLFKLKNEKRGFLFLVKNRRDENANFKNILLDIVSIFPENLSIGIGLNITMPEEKIIRTSIGDVMNDLSSYTFSQKDFISVYVEESYE